MTPKDGRVVTWLKDNWLFINEDVDDGSEIACDDSAWNPVRVPHDWAITGPFDETIDVHYTAIVADGETAKRNHTGRTAGLPHVGTGWYRIHLFLSDDDVNQRVRIEFDGVMSHAEVFLNGKRVGRWPYGYSSFAVDVTDAVAAGDNVLSVRCENPPLTSRWYPGAGMYRHVRLVVLPRIHVSHWGTYVTTTNVTENQASICVETEVDGDDGAKIELQTAIHRPDGREVAKSVSRGRIKRSCTFRQTLVIADPQFWSLEERNRYVVRSTVLSEAGTDVYETPFGIRTLSFDANSGFALNGKMMKLNGVCMHHDLGPLGAAVNVDALRRQLESLQEMGCNAIRTSHNPPTPELLELCDEMGFLVIDEAFDEWKIAKVENGYHTLFDEWAEKDLRAMIRRDRNHPSVIMWSIGNEILEQNYENGADTARFLAAICSDEDPTRPTTAGFNSPENAIVNGLADEVGIPGWNYRPYRYVKYKLEHPLWPMYGSETASCVSTRGEYYFPPEEERDVRRGTLQVTSYDVASPPWGYPPDVEFRAQDQCPFIMGEFVWTGWDYLGEPTPYKTEWPSRSSYFGIVDLCGIPKDRYFAYRAQWTDSPTLHTFPHWTWPGREGTLIPVHCYTNYDSVELFVNGVSKGVRKKEANSLSEQYRLVWEDVTYQAGELKAVAFDAGGSKAAERIVRTAEAPAAIRLEVDRDTVPADGDSMFFVSVAVVDQHGTLSPDADNTIQFSVEGPAEIAAVGNGDPTSTAPFKADIRKTFHGRCVAYVRSIGGAGGVIAVRCTSDDLDESSVTVVSS